jgi:hypothetical protein
MTLKLNTTETAVVLFALIALGELAAIAAAVTGSWEHHLLGAAAFGAALWLIFGMAFGRIELDRDSGVFSGLSPEGGDPDA